MCGITGIVDHRGPLDPRRISDMTRALRHRGPDDEGYLLVDTRNRTLEQRSGAGSVHELRRTYPDILESSTFNLALGHRRLTVIETSSLGHQPMSYYGRYWTVYNGEIYNYIELREELKREGFLFCSGSDTEVLLASYARWGFDCVTHFNGDWSFCIYDVGRNILFLSRDRYGVHFLYYFHDEQIFAFASEIKALLALPGIQKNVEPKRLAQFVMLGIMDHTEETMYKGVLQVKPGENLVFDLTRNTLSRAPYYQLQHNLELGQYEEKTARTFAAEIHDLLYDAVRIRLRSDVPVGTCLSGGLDSSTIVLMINRLIREGGAPPAQIGTHQKTFTASYGDDPVDEAAYAREVISMADVDGKFVFPGGDGLWRELESLAYAQDDPFGSPAEYAQWNVMRLASEGVKVVLDGQGGDELFAGYLSHLPFAYAQSGFPLLMDRAKLYGIGTIKDFVLGLGIRFIPLSLRVRSFSALLINRLRFFRSLFPSVITDAFDVDEIVYDVVKPDLNSRLALDFRKYTIPQLLHYEDRNSTAFSVEARVPYLDYRLVDYVMAIPAVYKISQGWTKWIFRLAMQDVLPQRILWRKDKLGFTTPERRWLSEKDVPFRKFLVEQRIPYDGDYFWWRLYIGSRWLESSTVSHPHGRG